MIAVPAAIGPAILDDAKLSEDGRYRYWLTRCTRATPWNLLPHYGYVNFICLNPSTADDRLDDPTVRRIRGFAKSWGYDGFWLTNLFAYRATDPMDLCMAQGDILGPDNLEWIREVAKRATIVVAAWGAVDGLFRNNVRFAQRQASAICNVVLVDVDLYALGTTKAGFPRHPLYIKGDTLPGIWRRGQR